jgi:hypothetical protein
MNTIPISTASGTSKSRLPRLQLRRHRTKDWDDWVAGNQIRALRLRMQPAKENYSRQSCAPLWTRCARDLGCLPELHGHIPAAVYGCLEDDRRGFSLAFGNLAASHWYDRF